MNKKISFGLLLLFIITSYSSLAQDYIWAQSAGSTSRSDKLIAMRTDSLGYIYAAGYFGDNMDLGTNQLNLQYTYNNSSKEVWLAKFDSTGFCYWAISGGRYYDDRILGMDVDPAGNIVVTGTYWHGSSGFDLNGYIIGAGPGNGSADQGFVAKVNTHGVVQWGHVIRSNQGDDQGMDVAIDKSGNVYTCGFMVGNDLYGGQTLLATDNNTGSYEQPYFVIKQDAAGNFLWAKTFGNLPYDSAYGKYIERDIACCVDENDNVYVTGGFDHTRVFGNVSLTSEGHYDGFLISYDGNGTFRYAKKFGSRKKDWSNGICSDKQGHIYIVGEHRDSLYYDHQFMAKNYDGRDVFVLKINNTDGSPIWGARAGSQDGGERGNDVVADENCNVYVCGDIRGGAKFGDNIILPPGDKQTFVARISPKGKWKWAATGGGPDDNDRANAIALGNNGQLYSGGFLRTAGVFGQTTLPYYGKADIWLARLRDHSFNKSYGLDLKNPPNREYCLGGSTVMDIPNHDTMYYWPTTGVSYDSVLSQLTFTPTETTTYTVVASIGEICKDIDTATFTIIVHAYPTAEFSLTPKQAQLVSPDFTMTNMSTGATNYEWYYLSNLLSTSTDYNYTASDVGEYCFELKASDAFGCRDSVEHCAEVVKKETFFLPNAFSPNGDTKNDVFIPIVSDVNINEILNYKLIIFNRWGQMVFETDDLTKGWDGTISKEPAPIGTYYFNCTYKSPDGQDVQIRNDVTLIR